MICTREDELLDALGRGYVGAELESHVRGCESCSELRNVAGALLDEQTIAMTEAPVPSAGTMWFRLQLRHRQEAQTAARRSLYAGQAITIAIALILALLVFRPQFIAEMRNVTSIPMLMTIVVATLIAVAAPIGGWFALRSK